MWCYQKLRLHQIITYLSSDHDFQTPAHVRKYQEYRYALEAIIHLFIFMR